VWSTFWQQFQAAAGVYIVGEVDTGNTSFAAPYQGPLDATLSYPMFFTLRDVFTNKVRPGGGGGAHTPHAITALVLLPPPLPPLAGVHERDPGEKEGAAGGGGVRWAAKPPAASAVTADAATSARHNQPPPPPCARVQGQWQAYQTAFKDISLLGSFM
jgi:hypothetical protein